MRKELKDKLDAEIAAIEQAFQKEVADKLGAVPPQYIEVTDPLVPPPVLSNEQIKQLSPEAREAHKDDIYDMVLEDVPNKNPDLLSASQILSRLSELASVAPHFLEPIKRGQNVGHVANVLDLLLKKDPSQRYGPYGAVYDAFNVASNRKRQVLNPAYQVYAANKPHIDAYLSNRKIQIEDKKKATKEYFQQEENRLQAEEEEERKAPEAAKKRKAEKLAAQRKALADKLDAEIAAIEQAFQAEVSQSRANLGAEPPLNHPSHQVYATNKFYSDQYINNRKIQIEDKKKATKESFQKEEIRLQAEEQALRQEAEALRLEQERIEQEKRKEEQALAEKLAAEEQVLAKKKAEEKALAKKLAAEEAAAKKKEEKAAAAKKKAAEEKDRQEQEWMGQRAEDDRAKGEVPRYIQQLVAQPGEPVQPGDDYGKDYIGLGEQDIALKIKRFTHPKDAYDTGVYKDFLEGRDLHNIEPLLKKMMQADPEYWGGRVEGQMLSAHKQAKERTRWVPNPNYEKEAEELKTKREKERQEREEQERQAAEELRQGVTTTMESMLSAVEEADQRRLAQEKRQKEEEEEKIRLELARQEREAEELKQKQVRQAEAERQEQERQEASRLDLERQAEAERQEQERQEAEERARRPVEQPRPPVQDQSEGTGNMSDLYGKNLAQQASQYGAVDPVDTAEKEINVLKRLIRKVEQGFDNDFADKNLERDREAELPLRIVRELEEALAQQAVQAGMTSEEGQKWIEEQLAQSFDLTDQEMNDDLQERLQRDLAQARQRAGEGTERIRRQRERVRGESDRNLQDIEERERSFLEGLEGTLSKDLERLEQKRPAPVSATQEVPEVDSIAPVPDLSAPLLALSPETIMGAMLDQGYHKPGNEAGDKFERGIDMYRLKPLFEKLAAQHPDHKDYPQSWVHEKLRKHNAALGRKKTVEHPDYPAYVARMQEMDKEADGLKDKKNRAAHDARNDYGTQREQARSHALDQQDALNREEEEILAALSRLQAQTDQKIQKAAEAKRALAERDASKKASLYGRTLVNRKRQGDMNAEEQGVYTDLMDHAYGSVQDGAEEHARKNFETELEIRARAQDLIEEADERYRQGRIELQGLPAAERNERTKKLLKEREEAHKGVEQRARNAVRFEEDQKLRDLAADIRKKEEDLEKAMREESEAQSAIAKQKELLEKAMAEEARRLAEEPPSSGMHEDEKPGMELELEPAQGSWTLKEQPDPQPRVGHDASSRTLEMLKEQHGQLQSKEQESKDRAERMKEASAGDLATQKEALAKAQQAFKSSQQFKANLPPQDLHSLIRKNYNKQFYLASDAESFTKKLIDRAVQDLDANPVERERLEQEAFERSEKPFLDHMAEERWKHYETNVKPRLDFRANQRGWGMNSAAKDRMMVDSAEQQQKEIEHLKKLFRLQVGDQSHKRRTNEVMAQAAAVEAINNLIGIHERTSDRAFKMKDKERDLMNTILKQNATEAEKEKIEELEEVRAADQKRANRFAEQERSRNEGVWRYQQEQERQHDRHYEEANRRYDPQYTQNQMGHIQNKIGNNAQRAAQVVHLQHMSIQDLRALAAQDRSNGLYNSAAQKLLLEKETELRNLAWQQGTSYIASTMGPWNGNGS